MTFLPIVERELRVAARLRRTYWFRVGLAAVALVVGAWILLTSRFFGGAGRAGPMMFGALNALAFPYCLLAGIFKTADCLSEEKREGTLGLLFLTDLKGYDVVLGKMAARSLHWFDGLLAAFPLLAVSMLAGGVMPGEVWRTILALLNTLFFSLAAGMVVSSVSRSERMAALGTVGLLFLFWAIPTWIGEWQRPPGVPAWPGLKLAWPGQAHDYASSMRYPSSPRVFWATLAVSHLAGWLMLGLASVLLRRAWQEKAATLKASRWAGRRQNWRFGATGVRSAFRQRILEINPIDWLASRELWKRQWVYAALVLGVGYFVCDMLIDPSEWSDRSSFLFPALFMQAGLKIWMAFEACRRFVDDRQSGALELVLVTPMEVPQILRGQWRALLRQFSGPVIALLAFDLFLVWGGLNSTAAGGPELPLFLAMFAAGIGIFLVDLWTLGWLAMRLGMVFRHAYMAGGVALGVVLVAPWIMFYMALTGVMMMATAMSNRGFGSLFATRFSIELTVGMAVSGWFLVSMAIDLGFGLWARRTLRRHFRPLAARERKFQNARATVATERSKTKRLWRKQPTP